MATIQKQTFNQNNIVDDHLWLIDQIREETLQKIGGFFDSINIEFGDLLKFLKNPVIYPGKTIGLEQIIERFLNVTISNYYKKIQTEGLPIKFLINTVRENLFQGSWNVKRDLNITMATRGGNDARKALSTSRIDEPPRLISIKNKTYKAKSKQKPKKRSKRSVKIKVPMKDKRRDISNQCDYCGAYVKTRKTHINICQNPPHHHFCSKECKISWIFGLNEINEKISQED